jgi:hypothetical protein
VLRGREVDYANTNDSPDESEILKQYGADSICTAIMEPGDFLVFDHHTLHRTQPMGQTYPVRVSGELRFSETKPLP